ncbi:HU family DNA-binding protein [Rickettsia endosymbiont of Halotydeus destructor]|uniref:HU family DNA-binding protein n=1 Tax=Rickettsia endosymbiont of Halotydeus destructor TaxID=2996754 RepID=UPI003BB10181
MTNKSSSNSYLIDKIHNELNYFSKEDIADSLTLVLNYLGESLKEQERIEIRGFGNFSIRQRKFPKSDYFYKTIYYRMPKNLFKD